MSYGFKRAFSLVCVLSLCVLSTSVRAGKVLDEILNNMRLGEPAMLQDQNSALEVTKDSPVGQTITTGDKTTKICRIAVCLRQDAPGWDKGENLLLNLYDTPQKKTKLASFAMESSMACWDDGISAFPLRADVKPNTSYYFELTVQSGDGKIPLLHKATADYPGGCAYIGGKPQQFDIWFETHVKPDMDRDAVYLRAFSEINLNYPGLERVKTAVETKDWDAAVKELVARFESNPSRVPPLEKRRERKLNPSFDTRLADLVCEQKYLDANDQIIDLRPDWNHLRWWPTRGGIGLTRAGLRKDLAHAYGATRNEKYAKAWNDMLVAHFTYLPSPLLADVIKPGDKGINPAPPGGLAGGSMWAGLSIGARMGHGFAYYADFVDSPSFELDTRAAFIFDLVNMARVLEVQEGGGNWATQMTTSLFEFGDHYPEFARSKEWFAMGYKGVLDNLHTTLTPDGPIGESSGYQTMCAGGFRDTLERAKALGLDVPGDAWQKVEKAYVFHMLTMFPDGRIPAWGDGNSHEIRKMMKEGYDSFGRQDMQWVATSGSEGSPPSTASICFPHTGYFVTRSDWTPDARFLCLHNAGYTSHGHADSLSFVLAAYGTELITDPGVYIYGTPEMIRQSATCSHSTISVDDRNLERHCGDTLWFSGNCVDFIDAVGAGYGADLDATPARRLIFLKPDYWVISDVVKGSGKHKVDSRFHFGANQQIEIEPGTDITRTKNASGGNLAIIPVIPQKITSTVEQGDVASGREMNEPAPILKFSGEVELPLRQDLVLYPYKNTVRENARVTNLQGDGQVNAYQSALMIEGPKGTDYIGFGDNTCASQSFSGGALKMAGRNVVIRKDTTGKVRSFFLGMGKAVVLNKQVLALSSIPVSALDVVYNGDTVDITVKDPCQSLKIWAAGARKIMINGKPVKVKVVNGYIKPFVHLPQEDAVIVDCETPGFVIHKGFVGGKLAAPNAYGLMFHWCHTAPGRDISCSWTPDLKKPGVYEVRAHIPSLHHQLSDCAHYTIKLKPGGKYKLAPTSSVIPEQTKPEEGTVSVRVDLRPFADKWVTLGTFECEPGSKLILQADSLKDRGPVVPADAVKWIFTNAECGVRNAE